MKKAYIGFLLVCILGFVLVGCDNGTTKKDSALYNASKINEKEIADNVKNNYLDGVWIANHDDGSEQYQIKLIFNKDTFESSRYYSYNKINSSGIIYEYGFDEKGTYTTDGKKLTITSTLISVREYNIGELIDTSWYSKNDYDTLSAKYPSAVYTKQEFEDDFATEIINYYIEGNNLTFENSLYIFIRQP